MTNPPPQPVPTIRESVAAIDETHPLKMPFMADTTTLYPRLDRLDAKVAFFVDYIEALTARIADLETRLAERSE
jgi:hypothetical protein